MEIAISLILIGSIFLIFVVVSTKALKADLNKTMQNYPKHRFEFIDVIHFSERSVDEQVEDSAELYVIRDLENGKIYVISSLYCINAKLNVIFGNATITMKTATGEKSRVELFAKGDFWIKNEDKITESRYMNNSKYISHINQKNSLKDITATASFIKGVIKFDETK